MSVLEGHLGKRKGEKNWGKHLSKLKGNAANTLLLIVDKSHQTVCEWVRRYFHDFYSLSVAPNAFVLSQGISNRFNSKNTQTNLQSPWSLQSRHMSASTTMWLTDVFLIIFGSPDSSVCLWWSVLLMSCFFLYNPDSRHFGTLRKTCGIFHTVFCSSCPNMFMHVCVIVKRF